MKTIFLLALLVFVGAKGDDSNESDDNDDNDDDMSDERNGRDFNSFGGVGNNGSSSFGMKKMMKKLTDICVDVKFPKEMYNSFKECLKEEANKSPVFDDMLEGNFPDREEIAKMFESLEMCKLKMGGINDLDKDYTNENIMKFMMSDRWTGDRQDIEELRQKITTCLDEAQGSGFEKVMNHHKCLLDYYVDKCRQKDDDPGMLLNIGVKISTLHEDSKCAPVKIPEKDKQIIDECMTETSEVFRTSPEPTNDPFKIQVPQQFEKPVKLLNRFVMNFLMKGLIECYGEKTNTYDIKTKLMNMTSYVDQVRQYEGWEGIEQERDAVIQAMMECGREYDEEIENDTDDEKLKDFMEDSKDFVACFNPKFAKICGFNNDLAAAFDPLMDSELLGKLYKEFMKVGGKEAEDLITLLKAELQKFKDQ